MADPAIITSHLICSAARERLTVLLSGMGGDEVFAGYPRHAAVKIAEAYNLIPSFLSRPVVDALPGARPGRLTALFRNTKKLARSAALPQRERYLGFGTYFTEEEKRGLYSGAMHEAANRFDPYREHRKYFERVASQDFVNQMLYVDLKRSAVLESTYTDKTSMPRRWRCVSRCWIMNWWSCGADSGAAETEGVDWQTHLKRAAEAWLPPEIINRRKAGFSAPIRAWLVRDLREMGEDLLSVPNIKRRGYFDYGFVRRLIDQNLSGREDNSLKVFQLLTLELWHRAFIDDVASVKDDS